MYIRCHITHYNNFLYYTVLQMNDPKQDVKRINKNSIKLTTNDEPWGPQPAKRSIQLFDKV